MLLSRLMFPTIEVVLQTFWFDLNPGRVIAISYALNDYNRAHHILRHPGGAPAPSVILQPSVEWDSHDFKYLLVEISKEQKQYGSTNSLFHDLLRNRSEPILSAYSISTLVSRRAFVSLTLQTIICSKV